jgi:SHS2 domain-containing protein
MTLSISADSLAHLFEQAANQYLDQLIDRSEIGETLQEKLVVDAEDVASLFKSWLAGLLSLVKDQHILPKRVAVQRLEMAAGKPYTIRAEIIGELLDPHRHTLKKTPDRLKIRETSVQSDAGGWTAQISFQTT